MSKNAALMGFGMALTAAGQGIDRKYWYQMQEKKEANLNAIANRRLNIAQQTADNTRDQASAAQATTEELAAGRVALMASETSRNAAMTGEIPADSQSDRDYKTKMGDAAEQTAATGVTVAATGAAAQAETVRHNPVMEGIEQERNRIQALLQSDAASRAAADDQYKQAVAQNQKDGVVAELKKEEHDVSSAMIDAQLGEGGLNPLALTLVKESFGAMMNPRAIKEALSDPNYISNIVAQGEGQFDANDVTAITNLFEAVIANHTYLIPKDSQLPPSEILNRYPRLRTVMGDVGAAMPAAPVAPPAPQAMPTGTGTPLMNPVEGYTPFSELDFTGQPKTRGSW